jgi:hypothetical protein
VSKPVTRIIKRPEDLQPLLMFLQGRTDYPYTVTIKAGEPKRTEKQNRLLYQWYMDIERQGDQTAPEARAECKLTIGVPILRAGNDDFRLQYDELIRPLEYIDKLALMLEPICLPVTSLMTVKMKTQYLDQIWQKYTGQGYQLTDPSILGLDDCWQRCGDENQEV